MTSDAKPGDSIAVSGVCLTVVENAGGSFTADVMKETLTRSSLGGAAHRVSAVNLERAVTPTTRLGGHIVQGHVDGVGEVLERTPAEHWELVRVSLPAELEPVRRGEGLDHRRRHQPDGGQRGRVDPTSQLHREPHPRDAAAARPSARHRRAPP